MNSPQQLRKRRNAEKAGTSGDVTETGTGSGSGAGAGAGATAAGTSHHDAQVSATPKQDPQQQQQQPQQQSWKFWLRVLKCGRVAAFRLVLLATAIVVYVHTQQTCGLSQASQALYSTVPVSKPCLPCTLPCANQHECLTVCWRPNVSPHHRRSRAKEGHRHAVLVCRVAGWLGLSPSHLYMAASLPGSLRLGRHRAITAVSMLCCHADCPSAPLHAHTSL